MFTLAGSKSLLRAIPFFLFLSSLTKNLGSQTRSWSCFCFLCASSIALFFFLLLAFFFSLFPFFYSKQTPCLLTLCLHIYVWRRTGETSECPSRERKCNRFPLVFVTGLPLFFFKVLLFFSLYCFYSFFHLFFFLLKYHYLLADCYIYMRCNWEAAAALRLVFLFSFFGCFRNSFHFSLLSSHHWELRKLFLFFFLTTNLAQASRLVFLIIFLTISLFLFFFCRCPLR